MSSVGALLLMVMGTITVAMAAGGPPATPLVNVIDTRSMPPGFGKWISDIYNGNLVVFGLAVVVIMAVQGAVLGYGLDRIVRLIGIDLGKLDHHE
jgi:hypothetical protein